MDVGLELRVVHFMEAEDIRLTATKKTRSKSRSATTTATTTTTSEQTADASRDRQPQQLLS
jgi:hypothetical protein